ncbi:MAG: TAXI family TRAP transporter solute-binding subunit [Candidatus Odyssella sp.]|nr:TAXI family TRAP transporter solute-binding subunit [Candidatus Odyssella sp.]
MHWLRTLAAALISAALAATPASAQQLGIGTMGQGTAGYSMSAAIAKVLSDKAKIAARVQPAGGTSQFVPLVDSGELDFGVVNIIEAKEALTGTGAFEGKKQANIRMAAVLYPFRNGMFVRNDSPLKTTKDLKGARVSYGYTSQLTLKAVTDAYLANGGLTIADAKPVLVPNVLRGADEIVAGRADASIFALGAGKVAEVNATISGGVRFLQLDDSPEAVARMQKVLPEAYIITVKPAAALAGIVGDTKTMAYDYVLIVGRHVKNETVAQVVDVLAANKAALSEAFGGFQGFEPAGMAKRLPVEYHPGAIEAYTKRGQWPPQ